MLNKYWLRNISLFIGISGLIACDGHNETSVTSTSIEEKTEEITKKPKLDVPITDQRFRVDSVISGKNVLLILNRADVPIGELTDFYLKVDGVDPDDIAISTDTKQGLVSKNKEKYYFSVKGTEGAEKIILKILVTDDSGNRSSMGSITIPVALKK